MKIAIIEKSPIVLNGVSTILKSLIDEIEPIECITYQELLMVTEIPIPYFIIYGVNNLSNKECLAEIQIINRAISGASVIVLDDKLDRSIVSELFAEGVQGYLTKLDEISDLKKCIIDVKNGKRYIGSETIIRLLQEQSVENAAKGKGPIRSTRLRSHRSQLSTGEQKIASFLCKGKRTSQIAFELGKKPSTISTVKANIFRKLDISNILDLRLALNQD
jgi:DNA-binding NarL/FixJ family response regulator